MVHNARQAAAVLAVDEVELTYRRHQHGLARDENDESAKLNSNSGAEARWILPRAILMAVQEAAAVTVMAGVTTQLMTTRVVKESKVAKANEGSCELAICAEEKRFGVMERLVRVRMAPRGIFVSRRISCKGESFWRQRLKQRVSLTVLQPRSLLIG